MEISGFCVIFLLASGFRGIKHPWRYTIVMRYDRGRVTIVKKT